jgi:hypothetical protein
VVERLTPWVDPSQQNLLIERCDSLEAPSPAYTPASHRVSRRAAEREASINAQNPVQSSDPRPATSKRANLACGVEGLGFRV